MDERDPFEPGLARDPAPGPGGLFASLRQLLANLLELAQTRAELLTTELSAEIQRAVGVLLWAFIALFFGGLAVLMLALTVIIAVWDEHRLLAAGVFSGLFLGVTLVAGWVVRSRIQSRPRLLAASLEELRLDREALQRGAVGRGAARAPDPRT
jgi:uncharacterized membrane protein YqjE